MAIRRARRSPAEGIYEPNMTPLVDVSLVLVVILLVATPLAFQSGIAVSAAAKSGRSGPKQERVEQIEIEVLADGGLRVNRQAVPRSGLATALKPLIQESPTRRVVVRCADGVSHGGLVSVLDEAKQLGASHIALVGE